MSKQRFEMVEGGASKFWQVEPIGAELHIAWGKIGTAGQSQIKAFADEATARAAADELIQEKTGKGYVSTDGTASPSPSAAPATDTTRLEYVIADFDAEDSVVFEVRSDAGALEVRRADASETTSAEALESARGIWILAQGARLPAEADAKQTPPFVVSRAVRDALALGECTFVTGFAPDREIVLGAVEPDTLDEDATEVVSKWRGPKLVARSDAGDELVIANAEVPQLLYFRTDDVCTVSWSSGVLEGATKKAPRPKAKKPAGKRQSAAEILASTTSSRAERLKAIKALGKSASDEAMTALCAAMLSTEREVSSAACNELSRAHHQRVRDGNRFDALPVLREAMASAGEAPLLPSNEPDLHPVSAAFSTYFSISNDDLREELTSILRTVAWTSPRGIATRVARTMLVHRGDGESIERVSSMLLEPTMAAPASLALHRLGEVGVARAKEQLAAADPAARLQAANALFNHLDLQPPSTIDAAAWWKVLEEPLAADPYGSPRYGRFRDKHGLRG